MAFRHIVLLTLADDAPPGRADEIVAALRRLPSAIPELRTYVVGVDAGVSPGNATIAVVADTDDQAGWERYRDHPEHQQVIAELIAPVLAARTAVQHHVEP
ncbi:Dabb family protein [Rhabdothermincola salaria]|uniref:Dabb family protein n=1 Tax=Rhabdothermincola salaria TaxID=2903142 RepID=UPI001E452CDE|nr:Dabb family protein [Rhabdothermincola salaria]MCD9624382.1 Dabb family protein [Rhabdothermincola salaria]